mmetsp:Transcript_57975/g.168153  ORF Transcript_57975/g.168153 Transcript_57975/m.168153 type:complete len:544 (-) Transcript_57975:73-1704(-)
MLVGLRELPGEPLATRAELEGATDRDVHGVADRHGAAAADVLGEAEQQVQAHAPGGVEPEQQLQRRGHRAGARERPVLPRPVEQEREGLRHHPELGHRRREGLGLLGGPAKRAGAEQEPQHADRVRDRRRRQAAHGRVGQHGQTERLRPVLRQRPPGPLASGTEPGQQHQDPGDRPRVPRVPRHIRGARRTIVGVGTVGHGGVAGLGRGVRGVEGGLREAQHRPEGGNAGGRELLDGRRGDDVQERIARDGALRDQRRGLAHVVHGQTLLAGVHAVHQAQRHGHAGGGRPPGERADEGVVAGRCQGGPRRVRDLLPIEGLGVGAPQLAEKLRAALVRLALAVLPAGLAAAQHQARGRAGAGARRQQHGLRVQRVVRRLGLPRGRHREGVLHLRQQQLQRAACREEQQAGQEVPRQHAAVPNQRLQQLPSGGFGEALHPRAEDAADPSEAMAPEEAELGVCAREARADADQTGAETLRHKEQRVKQLRVAVLRETGSAEAPQQVPARLEGGLEELGVGALGGADVVDRLPVVLQVEAQRVQIQV